MIITSVGYSSPMLKSGVNLLDTTNKKYILKKTNKNVKSTLKLAGDTIPALAATLNKL